MDETQSQPFQLSLNRSRPWKLLAAGTFFLALFLVSILSRARVTAASSAQQIARVPYNPPPHSIYDPDPHQIWNRLFLKLYVREGWDGREYGGDELDPYLPAQTEYLIEEPSHKQAMDLFDEFLSTHAERLITDPLKRAVLQRDLLAVFGWVSSRYSEEKAPGLELEEKLAQVMRRLALTPQQIRALPDTYSAAVNSHSFPTAYNPAHPEQSFLPSDLFDPNGPWVCLGFPDGYPGARAHANFFDGRSTFFVFLRLPEGRAATLEYLKKLRDYPKPFVPVADDFYMVLPGVGVVRNSDLNHVPNPSLPQFPAGTQVALVRRMTLIDDRGEPTPTSLVESIQLRVFARISSSRAEWLSNRASQSQDVFEFRLDRPRLFAGEASGLRAISKVDGDFPLFLTNGMDLFAVEFKPNPGESRETSQTPSLLSPILAACDHCHGAPGIYSMLAPRTIWSRLTEEKLLFQDSTPAEQIAITAASARKSEEWAKLQALWK
jgi:hypothetical protein